MRAYKNIVGMEGHRHTVHIQTKSADYPELLNLDPSTRVMVFCAKVSDPGRQDISFPQQSEIKVNGEVNRKSLRGIKNKPGTTRPLDVTDWMRLKAPKYPNDIEFIYALTREAGVIPVSHQAPFCIMMSWRKSSPSSPHYY